MPIIDAQVHTYERNHPARPWVGVMHGRDEVTGEQMVAAMDAVGVDGALLVSPYTNYRFDASYALQVGAAHPGRFGLIKPVDPARPDVAEDIAEWASNPSTVGVRVLFMHGTSSDPADAGLTRVFAAAARHGLPVNFMCWDRLEDLAALAASHPDNLVVVDHLGLRQPFEPPPLAEPWTDLPKMLALAALPNVHIKVTGVCTMSRLAFPYVDIWDPVCRVLDAFGLERCMWGTDWTRTSPFLTYEQGVRAFQLTDRLSDSDRAALMGGTLARVYNWSPAPKQ